MSWNRFFEPTDMEDRKGLRPVDTAQLIITGTFFIGSVLIVQKFDDCNGEGRAWYYSMLYGNLFWIFYLFTTLVGKYKNRMIRFFFTIVDYLFYLFHIGMLIWNYTLWVRKDSKLGGFVDTCNDAANFFADCYRYLGYFFAAVLFIGIFALVCSKIRPKPKLEEMTYGDDVPDYSNGRALNPYGNINRGPAGDGKPNPAAK